MKNPFGHIVREANMAGNPGVKVVLTASATEMSEFYNSPFITFVAGFGKGPIPLWFVRKKL